MNNSLTYIDDYFTGTLNDDERRSFERRCAADEDFAREVAKYISMRDGINAHLQQKKKEEFSKLYQELSAPTKSSKIITLKRIVYLAAASVLLLMGWLMFFQQSASQKIAGQYIAANLKTLGLSMGVSDSLQMGITAYNNKSYPSAEGFFKPLAHKPQASPEAIEYLGVTYLANKQYEEALKSFDELSAMSLKINKGKLYKALTLMKRSKGTDTEQAKKILQEIISKNLYGKYEADNWIKQL